MKYFKKTLKYLGKFILFFLTFIVIYIISALILSNITINGSKNTAQEIDIYIKTNGVHTDLVLPIKTKEKDWSEQILFKNTVSKDTTFKYIALGWGDRAFYLETPTWGDLKFSVAFKAAAALSKTAMHATFYKSIQENNSCVKIPISSDEYKKLIEYTENSFSKDTQNQFININTKSNYGKNDAFYEANGSYSLFKTCNTWTNSALKKANQKHALWTPTDFGIFVHYKK